MNLIDSTKLESWIIRFRWWLDERRGEPSHWMALCGSFGSLAAVGLILAAAKAFGIGPVLVVAYFGGALTGAILGQRAEGD